MCLSVMCQINRKLCFGIHEIMSFRKKVLLSFSFRLFSSPHQYSRASMVWCTLVPVTRCFRVLSVKSFTADVIWRWLLLQDVTSFVHVPGMLFWTFVILHLIWRRCDAYIVTTQTHELPAQLHVKRTWRTKKRWNKQCFVFIVNATLRQSESEAFVLNVVHETISFNNFAAIFLEVSDEATVTSPATKRTS